MKGFVELREDVVAVDVGGRPDVELHGLRTRGDLPDALRLITTDRSMAQEAHVDRCVAASSGGHDGDNPAFLQLVWARPTRLDDHISQFRGKPEANALFAACWMVTFTYR